jgi:hypothetical protein
MSSLCKYSITQTSLPNWRHLVSGLIPFTQVKSLLSIPWKQGNEIAGWFSRSAWSLAMIAIWKLQENNSESLRIWIPDYFCNAALAPLRCLNVELAFYPVSLEGEPDYEILDRMAKIEPPDIFLLVHYFGIPTVTSKVYGFCSNYNAWMIEDAAHLLHPVKGVGTSGDFVLYSPHKLLPIPDGSLLLVRPNGPSMLEKKQIKEFGSPEKWAENLSTLGKWHQVSINNHYYFNKIWLIKRILQKLGIRGRKKQLDFMNVNEGQLNGQRTIMPEPAMSNLSDRILESIIPNLARISHYRLQNKAKWEKLIIELMTKYPHWFQSDKSRHNCEYTPYMVTLKVKTEFGQNVSDLFQNQGIPVMTWPDLPPEVYKNKDKHLPAMELRLAKIFLPCHQTMRFEQFNLLAK